MHNLPNHKRVKVNRFSGSGFIPRIKLKISPENLNGALNNDLVAFEELINSKSPLDPGEGKITQVIKRFKTNFVVKVISVNNESISVFFDDPQLPGLIEIWGNFEGVKKSDKIFIKLLSFPPQKIQGKIIKILNSSSVGEIEFDSLVCDLKLPGKFSGQEIQKEINHLMLKKEKILSNKDLYKNLENKYFFTVDGVKAKDFDDAICAEKLKNEFILYVAIADVWGYLSKCPNIFNEAKRRGTSIYLLDRVIPMLPPILSEELCSLVEGQTKYTVCCSVNIDLSGKIKHNTLRIFPATIVSRKRFNYQELNEFFELSKKTTRSRVYDKKVEESVLTALEIVNVIQEKKNKENNQSLKIFQEKFDFEINENEEIIEIKKNNLSNTPSQKLVETCMILANQLIAQFLENRNIPAIYRVHKAPFVDRLQTFAEEVKELGCNINFFDSYQMEANKLNEILKKVEDHPHYSIIQYNLLQALPKAEYRTENIGHFGINSKHYLHFTSPIRRLPDLLVHKALWMYYFLGQHSKQNKSKFSSNLFSLTLKDMSYFSNLTEQRSVIAEKRFTSRKLYKYLCSVVPGEIFNGVVTSRGDWGYTVSVEKIYDGFVRTTQKRRLGQEVKLKKVEYSWDEFTEC